MGRKRLEDDHPQLLISANDYTYLLTIRSIIETIENKEQNAICEQLVNKS